MNTIGEIFKSPPWDVKFATEKALHFNLVKANSLCVLLSDNTRLVPSLVEVGEGLKTIGIKSAFSIGTAAGRIIAFSLSADRSLDFSNTIEMKAFKNLHVHANEAQIKFDAGEKPPGVLFLDINENQIFWVSCWEVQYFEPVTKE